MKYDAITRSNYAHSRISKRYLGKNDRQSVVRRIYHSEVMIRQSVFKRLLTPEEKKQAMRCAESRYERSKKHGT